MADGVAVVVAQGALGRTILFDVVGQFAQDAGGFVVQILEEGVVGKFEIDDDPFWLFGCHDFFRFLLLFGVSVLDFVGYCKRTIFLGGYLGGV